MSDENGNRRAQFAVRFLLENLGGLLSLFAVIFAAGILYHKVDALADAVQNIGTQQDTQTADIAAVKTDIAVLKSQLSNLERRQP